MSTIFQHDGCQVTQAPGGFQVREERTGKDYFVRLEIRFRKSAPGGCSCGSRAAEAPLFECRHQRAVSALLYQRHLSRLARSGLFRHPERLTLKFEREQRHVLRAFSRASRAGPLPAPTAAKPSQLRIGTAGREARRPLIEAPLKASADGDAKEDGWLGTSASRPQDADASQRDEKPMIEAALLGARVARPQPPSRLQPPTRPPARRQIRRYLQSPE